MADKISINSKITISKTFKPKVVITKYKYTNMMTLKEWKQFVKNYDPTYKKSNNLDSSGMTIKMSLLIAEKEESFRMLIKYAFDWSKTKEGYFYWRSICNRTKPVE